MRTCPTSVSRLSAHRQPKLTVCVNGRFARFIHIDFVWELLDGVIYNTNFSKIYDIVMNDEMKLTYLLFSVYLSVLCVGMNLTRR